MNAPRDGYFINANRAAADVGRAITSADVLAVRKMAVKLPGAPASKWILVDEANSYWDPGTLKFIPIRSAVPVVAPASVSLIGGTPLDQWGYAAPVPGAAVGLAPLADSAVLPLATVAIYDSAANVAGRWTSCRTGTPPPAG